MGIVQMLTDNIPNAKLGKAGIFQKGRNFEEVALSTKTIEPPFDDIDEEIAMEAIHDPMREDGKGWLARCLEKTYTLRPKPAEVLEDEWFKGGALERCSDEFIQRCP